MIRYWLDRLKIELAKVFCPECIGEWLLREPDDQSDLR